MIKLLKTYCRRNFSKIKTNLNQNSFNLLFFFRDIKPDNILLDEEGKHEIILLL